mmetsp:Transcript_14801/g.20604  ORF Transcript_14801/g.20604 Transcript_14801/m.20604 type:complete len:211 (-) Transcript_14801:266-898(-)
MTKIGHKCPTSGEYVIKPNMIRPNMSELGKRFLISFLAVDVVPTVSIELPTGKLQPGKAATIILFFRNPAAIPMQLVLEPRYVELEEKRKSRDENEQDTASKQMESITKLELASNKVIIPSHDELSEDMSHLYDSPKSPNDRREKGGLIIFKKLGKVGINAKIVPQLDANGEVKFDLNVTLIPSVDSKKHSRIKFESFSYVMHFNLGGIS